MVIQVICAFTCKVGLNWAFQKFLVNCYLLCSQTIISSFLSLQWVSPTDFIYGSVGRLYLLRATECSHTEMAIFPPHP